MPWIVTINARNPSPTTPVSEPPKDQVFIGVNNWANKRMEGTSNDGRTATVMVCNDGIAAREDRASFTPLIIESVPQRDKNPAGVRLAVHESGKVYALFYRAGRNQYRQVSVEQCDVCTCS
jgi:hypothetical protein